MTPPEFTQWFRYHCGRFPGVLGWFAKFPLRPRTDIEPIQDDIRSAWESCLDKSPLVDCKAATDAMFRGDIELPRSFDEHPRMVRSLAARIGHAAQRTIYRRDDLIPGETREETIAATRAALQEAIAIMSKSTRVPSATPTAAPAHVPLGSRKSERFDPDAHAAVSQ